MCEKSLVFMHKFHILLHCGNIMAVYLRILFVFVSFAMSVATGNITDVKSFENLVTMSGYSFKNHQVTTKDGYILELHQIPPSRTSDSVKLKNIPILLLHGVFQDSSAFVLNGEKLSPGFLLSGAGENVFLFNARGTLCSRKHIWLSPEKDWKFWDFCFDELGNFDLPAVVDYILDVTDEKQLYMIGFSMGGAAISVFLAENPLYNDKVRQAFLLAPSISVRQETHEALYLFGQFATVFFTMLDNDHVLPYSRQMFTYCYDVCGAPLMFQVCKKISTYAGYKNDPVDVDGVAANLADLVSGVMVKTLQHLLQMIVTDTFAKFDYGSKMNLVKYGQETPPLYNLENITTAITLFCSPNDTYISCEDIAVISRRFHNVKNISVVPVEDHMSFVGGKNARYYVYDIISREIRSTRVVIDAHGSLSEHLSGLFFNHVLFVVPVALFLLFGAIFFLLYLRIRRKSAQNDEKQALANSIAIFRNYNQ